MPSLSDTLDSLRTQSEQIAYLSSLNASPSGPFVQAYLGIPSAPHQPKGNVLDLIRDAQESERRLFKFVGEGDVPGLSGGVGGGNKRVEKREAGVVTPLRDLKRKSGPGAGGAARAGNQGRDEMEVMLKTAMKLVDDYRPMPRARAHIINLLDAHYQQVERLVELERLIAEAENPTQRQVSPPSSSHAASPRVPSEGETPKKLSPDEAIKAEEAALRALEASIQPLRRAAAAGSASGEGSRRTPSLSPAPASPPAASDSQAQATPGVQSRHTPFSARTPSAYARDEMRTPGREMPHVTNSLVNGTTPRRITNGIDRFSPLKFLTTPRVAGPSGLGNAGTGGRGGDGANRTIFGRAGSGRSMSGASRVSQAARAAQAEQVQTPAQAQSQAEPTPVRPVAAPAATVELQAASSKEVEQDEEPEYEQGAGDETIRLARPLSPRTDLESSEAHTQPAYTHTNGQEHEMVLDQPGPEVAESADQEEQSGPKKVGGVEVDAEGVRAGVAKIWSTLGEMMRQGPPGAQENDVESSLKHLYTLSQSDPPPPPSPSSSSSTSDLTTATDGSSSNSKPITSETILFAHLFLIILRSFSSSAAAAYENTATVGVDMNEVKEVLTSVAKARGWDASAGSAAGGLGTKIIYAAVGKRTVRIDRRGGGSGRVRFAE